MKKLSYVLSVGLMVLAVSACNEQGASNGQNTGSSSVKTVTSSQNEGEVLAEVGDLKITRAQIDEITKNRMMKIKSQVYSLEKSAIDEMIDNHLLEQKAKEESTTVQELVSKIRSEVKDPTESQLRTIYQLQKRRFGNKTFDEIKVQLASQVKRQEQEIALSTYLDKLREDVDVKINIERPRAEVSADDDPYKGPKDAPITLIEFSEFQCPYCKRARPVISQILKEYDGKVRYVFRDFPLGFHNQAKGAANAANCANDQGKYWAFNEQLWATQGSHSPEQLDKIAEDLDLKMDEFKKCVDSKKYYSEIAKDQKEGSDAGVGGTPAYFINGIFLSGAQPFESFKEVIDSELKLKGLN